MTSYAPDPARVTLYASAPFMLAPGRGIVDHIGRVIATAERAAGMAPWTADDNAHALANILNNPLAYACAYCRERQLAEPANAEFWRRLAGSLLKGSTM